MMQEHVRMMVDGREHPGLMQASINASTERASWRAVLQVHEERGRRIVWPGMPVTMLTGDEFLMSGFVRFIEPEVGKSKALTTVSVETKTCDAIECAAEADGFHLADVPLDQGVRRLFSPFGVEVRGEGDFKKVSMAWEPGKRAHEVAELYARDQDVRLMGDPDGGIYLLKGVRGAHAGALVVGGESGGIMLEVGKAKLSEVGRFSKVTAKGQKGRGDTAPDLRSEAEIEDASIRRYRPQILTKETAFDEEDMRNRLRARRSRTFGAETSLTGTVPIWRDDDGLLWKPAYTIFVDAFDDLALYQEMAISGLVLSWTKGTPGQSAELTLVEPSALGKGKKRRKGTGSKKTSGAWLVDDSEPRLKPAR